MDQIRKFGEQTSRILEFKPEGLDFQYLINQNDQNSNWKKILGFGNMQENLENSFCHFLIHSSKKNKQE